MLVLLYDTIRIAKQSNTKLYLVISNITPCPTVRLVLNNLELVGTTEHPTYKSYQHIYRLAYTIDSNCFYIYLGNSNYKKINLTTSQKLLIDTLVGLP